MEMDLDKAATKADEIDCMEKLTFSIRLWTEQYTWER